jgi:hypothetical protein
MTPPAKRVEVQFVVEQICPNCDAPSAELRARLEQRLPFVVWVYWPPLEPSAPCDGARFILTPKGHREAEIQCGKRMPGTRQVCERCGHLIE